MRINFAGGGPGEPYEPRGRDGKDPAAAPLGTRGIRISPAGTGQGGTRASPAEGNKGGTRTSPAGAALPPPAPPSLGIKFLFILLCFPTPA